jgi:hypothetical protein
VDQGQEEVGATCGLNGIEAKRVAAGAAGAAAEDGAVREEVVVVAAGGMAGVGAGSEGTAEVAGMAGGREVGQGGWGAGAGEGTGGINLTRGRVEGQGWLCDGQDYPKLCACVPKP